MINQTHWLGALLGSYNLIARPALRSAPLIDQGRPKITVPVACFALVLRKQDVAGNLFGSAREAWNEGRGSSQHESMFRWEGPSISGRVLSVLPKMYDEHLEPAPRACTNLSLPSRMAGEVVLYASAYYGIQFTPTELFP